MCNLTLTAVRLQIFYAALYKMVFVCSSQILWKVPATFAAQFKASNHYLYLIVRMIFCELQLSPIRPHMTCWSLSQLSLAKVKEHTLDTNTHAHTQAPVTNWQAILCSQSTMCFWTGVNLHRQSENMQTPHQGP